EICRLVDQRLVLSFWAPWRRLERQHVARRNLDLVALPKLQVSGQKLAFSCQGVQTRPQDYPVLFLEDLNARHVFTADAVFDDECWRAGLAVDDLHQHVLFRLLSHQSAKRRLATLALDDVKLPIIYLNGRHCLRACLSCRMQSSQNAQNT